MKVDIARAWKDPEYRKTLTAEQLASLPPNPAGSVSLNDEDLDSVAGGLTADATSTSQNLCTMQNCCIGGLKLPHTPVP
jgi:mersacidin/lichenicidin family type 2 lantibiotic